jgi:hypothetical protein
MVKCTSKTASMVILPQIALTVRTDDRIGRRVMPMLIGPFKKEGWEACILKTAISSLQVDPIRYDPDEVFAYLSPRENLC